MKALQRLTRSLVASVAAAALLVPAVQAQSTQPPAKILVGFAAGGTLDTIARMLAEKLQGPLGRTVIVDTKTGAGGRIAVDHLKAAPTDGSVAMMCPDFLSSIYPLVFRKLNYDPDTDFIVASTVAESPMGIAVPASSPAKTFAQYVDMVHANPGQANFGHGALGGPTYLLGLMLGRELKVEMRDVPFQGGAPMLTALAGDHVNAGISYLGDLAEYHKAGKIRILAITGNNRSALLPEVPTLPELGYKAFTATSVFSVCLPGRTPAAVVDKWSSAVAAALTDAQLRDRIAALNFTAVASTPAEAQQKHRALRAFWEPTVKASGFKAD